MKKGICIGSLPGEDLEDKFKLAEEAGFDGVEINTLYTPDERRFYKEIADSVDIEIPSIMNSKHWKKPLSDPDPYVRRESVQGVIASIETAGVVGADTVLLVPAVVNEQVTYEEAWERSRAEILEVSKVAEKKHVFIAIENVWNKFLLSPIEFARYIDEFESDYVVAYFDVGNIVFYGYPQHWIGTLGKRIKKVHVKGFNAEKRIFTYLYEGTIDWKVVRKTLEDVGYDDYLTAELPINRDDPEGTIRKINRDLDRIIAGKGSRPPS